MANQQWVAPLPPYHFADGPTVTAAALADLSPTPQVVIPAGLLSPGHRLEFAAFGRYTSTATPGTAVLGIYLSPSNAAIASGQALAISSALTVVASQTNRSWRIEGNCQVRSIGTAGTILGLLEISNVTATNTDLAPATAPAVATFDTTVPLTVRLGVTPSVATGSWICHYF